MRNKWTQIRKNDTQKSRETHHAVYLPVYFVIRLQLLSAVGAELRAGLHLLTARGADVRRFLLLAAVRAEFRTGVNCSPQFAQKLPFCAVGCC